MYLIKNSVHHSGKMRRVSLLLILGILFTSFSVFPVGWVQAAIQTAFYVDTVNGNDTNSGTMTQPFKTITRARDVVRGINGNMTGDIHVYLRGGIYSLTDTITFTEADSGSNGYNVIYKAYPGDKPRISGEKSVTGWVVHDPVHNIYKAVMGQEVETRQLYINGVRATRARSDGISGIWTYDAAGHTTTDVSIAGWGNSSDIEMVYKQTWTNPRCGVQSIGISNGKAIITMKQPGWYYSRNKGGTAATIPWYIENAYELLDQPGEWYLDRTTDTFYYKPRAGEDMATAAVSIPGVEKLLSIQGSNLDTPAHHIQFQDISFEYTTWLRPNGDTGHADAQSNIIRESGTTPPEKLTASAVHLRTAKSIVFERCKFSRLGSAAINMTYGSQDNLVRGCSFMDISGSGVQVGEIHENDEETNNPFDTREILRNNDIINNYFENLGVDYRSSVAVFGAYPMEMDVSNNEIYNLPYSGITLGWGWGTKETCTIGNRIQNNYIHDVMKVLVDGGPVYLLGTSHDVRISGNYLKDQHENYGAIYLDQGVSDVTAENNVMENVPLAFYVNPANNNTIRATYSNTYRYSDNGANNTLEKPVFVPDGNWPQAALDIMNNAGIQTAYKDIIPTASPTPTPAATPVVSPTPTPQPVVFTGKTSMITGLGDGAKLRNNYPSYVGMKMTVGSSPMTVTAIGRINMPGSMGVHNLKIVDAATGTELVKVPIYMSSAPANGAFKYVQLPAPLVLEANKSYYVVSEETPAGDDFWYDGTLKVTTTSVATADIGVYGSSYKNGDTAGNSFVGIDLLYVNGGSSTPVPVNLPKNIPGIKPPLEREAVSAPVDMTNTQGFIRNVIPGSLRNDWSGLTGMKVVMGTTPIAVTALGRLFVQGNSGLHRIKIVDAEISSEVSSTIVDMSGGSSGQFTYVQLPAPVMLAAGKTYYILSEETYGGDDWYTGDMMVQGTEGIATDSGAVYSTPVLLGSGEAYLTGSGTGNSLVGVDFRYTTDLSALQNANKIYNGSFEIGDGGWKPYNANYYRTTENTLNGSKGAARVDVMGAFGTLKQAVFLEKNKCYEISVWARMESGSSTAQIILDHTGGSPQYGYVAQNTTLDTTWRQLKGTYKYTGSNSTGLAFVQLRVGNGGSGYTYYFDDFEIIEAKDLVNNGTFDVNTGGWTAYNSTFSRVTSDTLDGSAGSAKVVVTNNYGMVYQPIAFEKNKEYEVSVWVRLSSGTNVAQMIIDHGSGTPRYEYLAVNTPVDTTWKQLKTTYRYTGTNATGLGNIQIRIGNGTTRPTYYFDDFKCIPVVLDTVSLEADSTSINEGDQTVLKVTGKMTNGTAVDFNKAQVTFTSSDMTVAEAVYGSKVNGTVYGKVLAKRGGAANIRAVVTLDGKQVESNGVSVSVADITPPVTSEQITGESENGVYKSDVTLMLTASDNASGVLKTEYSFDGGNTWSIYTVPIIISSNGRYIFTFRSIDNSGNKEYQKSVNIDIEKTADGLTSDLLKKIDGMYIDQGLKNSLTSKLNNGLKSIRKGDKNSSVNELNAFINAVNAQSGKKLTIQQANELKTAANIIVSIINSATMIGVPG